MSAVLGAAKAFANVPGPKSYPVVGSLPMYMTGRFDRLQYHRVLKALRQEFGPLVKEDLGGGRTIVHVFEPEDIQLVYAHEGRHPEIPPLQETTQLYRAQKKMSLGIGNTNGEEWYRLRSNSHQKMLRPKEVQHHLPAVNRVALDFCQRIEATKSPDTNEVVASGHLRTEVGRWNLETSSLLIFDKRMGCLEVGSQAEETARRMVEANSTVFRLAGILKLSYPLYRKFTTPKWREMVEAEDLMYSEAIRMVDEAVLRFRDEVEKGGTLTPDKFFFLSYLLSKPDLSLKDVTVICLSTVLDGLSTTTPTLLFLLYSLATNPRVQQKLHREVASVLNQDPAVTAEHIEKMPYLKAVVRENFRRWPNGTEISRYLGTDLTLSGFHVPRGTHVDLNPIVHFDDPDLFPDPEAFVPERWINKASSSAAAAGEDLEKWRPFWEAASKAHPFMLTPFGHGTRMCFGHALIDAIASDLQQ